MKYYKYSLFLIFIMLVAFCSFGAEAQVLLMNKKIEQEKPFFIDKNFSQIVVNIPKQPVIQISALQKLFGNTLERFNTTYTVFFKRKYKTKDNILFTVETRSSLTQPDITDIVILYLSKKTCVAIDTIKNPFQMIFLPPYTLHDAAPFYYEAPVDWGIFAISVSPFRKNCIDSIVIRGFGDDREKKDEINKRKASLRGEFDDFKKALGVQ
ncbi:hypothetical protein [Commensalibacter communis]|uniref:hypothetical protein n=1 Tax=Commensalibacter communis TaxID=2972786 RepID=UPI0022FF61FB|nr:hypothetical protein [Commensalibacter communis]CAI3958996.1 unnamed protein product [Commensalibacter communis]CAI3959373.1 unnamed protein product [Commensalibacter communis]